ncbi:CCAAT/enhancer-binding protein gamma [Lucilia cuprina]|uniref:CCAAT/enhancer-binding protein gamma n=1 Tax=Lucilia cuprina TaxID=7375 RepID=UPI001F053A73|nr:CCAAT/enhancer-binding protein gamma [Lucilia cuprina]
MPARRKASGLQSPQSDDTDKDTEAYQLKRKRNNDAVKKTREKSKQTAQVRKDNVNNLRIKNKELEATIVEVKSNIEYLKNALLHKVDSSKHSEVIQQILEQDSDEEENKDIAPV